jgi:hypothetical protein
MLAAIVAHGAVLRCLFMINLLAPAFYQVYNSAPGDEPRP